MASSSQLCESCSRATKSSMTVKYCSDCDESLCSDWFSVHGTFKGFISHHVSSMCFQIRDLNISTPLFTLSVLESHVTLLFCSCSLNLLAVSIKYLTSDAKSSNMVAIFTYFPAYTMFVCYTWFTADIVMIGTVKVKNHIFVVRTELIEFKRYISWYLGVHDVMRYKGFKCSVDA
jgi:hypothetical protein